MSTSPDKKVSYNVLTEIPGQKATREQVQRLYQRYRFAKNFADGKKVLEMACGSGMGLEYLAEEAASVIGGDIDERNVALAGERSKEIRSKEVKKKENIRVELMDAHDIDLPDQSVDLVILFEAIYYLRNPEKFVSEAKRVLRDDGKLIICTVNKDWEDFHPSPYTCRYFAVPELRDLLKDKFSEIKLYGGFPVTKEGIKDVLVSHIKRVALKFNLIPGSLKARAYLKRIFMGKLMPLPAEVYEGMAPYEEPVEIACDRVCKDYKIVYVVAKK